MVDTKDILSTQTTTSGRKRIYSAEFKQRISQLQDKTAAEMLAILTKEFPQYNLNKTKITSFCYNNNIKFVPLTKGGFKAGRQETSLWKMVRERVNQLEEYTSAEIYDIITNEFPELNITKVQFSKKLYAWGCTYKKQPHCGRRRY